MGQRAGSLMRRLDRGLPTRCQALREAEAGAATCGAVSLEAHQGRAQSVGHLARQ